MKPDSYDHPAGHRAPNRYQRPASTPRDILARRAAMAEEHARPTREARARLDAQEEAKRDARLAAHPGWGRDVVADCFLILAVLGLAFVVLMVVSAVVAVTEAVLAW